MCAIANPLLPIVIRLELKFKPMGFHPIPLRSDLAACQLFRCIMSNVQCDVSLKHASPAFCTRKERIAARLMKRNGPIDIVDRCATLFPNDPGMIRGSPNREYSRERKGRGRICIWFSKLAFRDFNEIRYTLISWFAHVRRREEVINVTTYE